MWERLFLCGVGFGAQCFIEECQALSFVECISDIWAVIWAPHTCKECWTAFLFIGAWSPISWRQSMWYPRGNLCTTALRLVLLCAGKFDVISHFKLPMKHPLVKRTSPSFYESIRLYEEVGGRSLWLGCSHLWGLACLRVTVVCICAVSGALLRYLQCCALAVC